MKFRNVVLIILVVCVISIAGCSNKSIESLPDNVSSGNSKFSIDYSWYKKNMCNHSISPEIILYNVPAQTVKLQWSLKDLQVPEYNHGSGKINVINIIREGSLRGYRGPCPPNSSALGHYYKFKIRALDLNGKVIGTAYKKVRCKRYRDMK